MQLGNTPSPLGLSEFTQTSELEASALCPVLNITNLKLLNRWESSTWENPSDLFIFYGILQLKYSSRLYL